MSEKMVRTQVYLTRRVHGKLTRRAREQGQPMASQIREALEIYLWRVDAGEEEPVFDPGDLFEILDRVRGEGPRDGAGGHDRYLYCVPHGEGRRSRAARTGVVRDRAAGRRGARRRSPAGDGPGGGVLGAGRLDGR